MKLMYYSWEKIKCVHSERADLTIINEVIITLSLRPDSLITNVSIWRGLERPFGLWKIISKTFILGFLLCLINVSVISKKLLRFSSSCLCAFSIDFNQRQDADSASSLNLFSWCKDSAARLHLHFYHCLLNLNNLSCFFQLSSLTML